MQTARQTLAFTAGSANSISLSQTPGAAGNLTITGSLASAGVATLPQVRRVSITSGGSSETGKNFTIYGTNAAGAAISEVLAGPGGSATVTSVLDYATVTRVAVSAATTGAVTVGTTGTPIASGPWIVPNRNVTPFNMSVGIYLISGTVSVTVEYTYDDPEGIIPSNSASPPNVFPMSDLTSVANTLDGILSHPVMALRATVNSGTGTFSFYTLQAGIKQ